MWRKTMIGLFSLGTLVMLTGCPDQETLDFLSAAGKISSNPADPPIGDLTSGEWVAMSKRIPDLVAQFGFALPTDFAIPVLTGQQAEDIVGFLDRNGIANVSQLSNLDPQTVQMPDSLQALF